MTGANEKLNQEDAICDFTTAKEGASLFNEFMLRVLQLETMHNLSYKHLSGFQHTLEKLRGPPLDKSSSMVTTLLKSIPSSRVARYQEAGCRHVHTEQQTFVKLNGFSMDLKEHILQAQSKVEELAKLVEKVIGLLDLDLERTREFVNIPPEENEADIDQDPHSEERRRQTSDYALLMSGILSMLEKDLQMQKLVVSDLRLDVDSECLQTYSQMWSLRPFVDERLLHLALSWHGK